MHKAIREVVISIDEEDIRYRFESPLQPAVHIEVFYLAVVLQECSPEKIV